MAWRAIGMAAGVMLNSVSPSPMSRPSSAGSDAISPHSDTGMLPARRGAAHEANQAQHGRMQRLVEVRDAIVGAIDGQAVLDQIVGADGQEVDFRREQIGGERRGRHFDHRADRRRRACRARPRPRRARACASRTSSTAGHERKHHAQPPVHRRRGRARAAACAESPAAPGRDAGRADRAAPRRRSPAARAELPLVEVERADRHRLRRHLLEQAAIERVLRVLGRARRASAPTA